MNELNHNIFPIDHNNIIDDLNIYTNIEGIIEFINLKNDTDYVSIFDDIKATYLIIAELRNYVPQIKNLKYVEFNIRNPLRITTESIYNYPNLINNTMLFDLTGKFSVALKFLYSIFVDSSKLSKDVDKYKELFYSIGIEMSINNFDLN
jgi:hypothetical protein